MLFLPGIDGALNLLAYRAADCFWGVMSVQSEMPAPLRAIRDSFHQIAVKPGWFGFVLVVLVNVIIGLIVWNVYRARHAARMKAHQPEQLFDDLVGGLDLTESERRLLREMAGGGRLAQPAMCLLSPGLLDWAWSAWREERGPGIATAAKHEQLDHISKKLFDHVTPSTAAG